MDSEAPEDSGLTHLHTGKVRDLYATDTGHLLMVASDRISAFDYILPTTIPDKGRILTAMTVWWFDQLADLVDNHLISYDDDLIPAPWRGRALLCRRLDMVPVEAIARGYLTGNGWLDYQATGGVCGISLPTGLADGSRLPEPIFTPTSKAPVGEHDENLKFDAVVAAVGPGHRRSGPRTHPGRLRPSPGRRGRTRHPAGRHQARIRAQPGHRRAGAGRRGAHAGLVALLAGRSLAARSAPGFLRQAVRPGLAYFAGLGLGSQLRPGPSAAAGRGGCGHPGPLPGGLRGIDRKSLCRLARSLTGSAA